MDANSMTTLILLGSFSLMVFLRFPIAYTVTLSSVFCPLFRGHNLTAICQQIVEDISSFSLMAVPFFITMECLMDSGSISEKLITLASTRVGWMRGDMAMVNIVAPYFFDDISDSISADTAPLGSILIPVMVDQGYDDDLSTVVAIASSCEGLLVPPSRNIVVYATTAGGISVGSLFLAGHIPGVLLAVTLMIGSYIISIKRNCPKGEKFSIINLVKQLSVSFWTLATMLIVVLGMVGDVFMATESVAVAIIYSLIVSVFIYKELDRKGVWRVLGDSVGALSVVMILIAAPNIFGFCLAQLHVPILAASAIAGMTNSLILLALLLNLIFLVLGCIMDVAPVILIATLVLLPIAASIGLGPIQLGIMVVSNYGIKLLTLLVGVVLFIGSAISKVPMERAVKATLPFCMCMIITLLLIILIPAISMWLPFILVH